MKIFSASIVALLIIFQSIGFAAVETFSASGEYLMSDYDTPEIAEEIALDFAKQNAAEQAGIYLETYSRTKDFEIDVSEINTVASSKVEVLTKNITRQPQQSGRVLLRADITTSVDTSELDNFLAQKHEQRQAAIQRYKELQKMNAEIKHDIDALQVKLAAVKDDVKDDDLLVEQERINRKALTIRKWSEFSKKFVERGTVDIGLIDDAIKLDPKASVNYLLHSTFVNYKSNDEIIKTALTAPDKLNSSSTVTNLKDISKAIILEPNNPTYRAMRGLHYQATGYFDKALDNYNKAIELDPQNALAYVERGRFYKNSLKDNDKALADFNRAIELEPKNIFAYESRSELHKDLKNYPDAISDLKSAIELGGENPDAFNYMKLGDMYQTTKNYSLALENYNKAIEILPKTFTDHRPLAYNSRAKLYIELGEFNKALADCDKGLELAAASQGNKTDIAFLNSTKRAATEKKTFADKYGNIDITNAAALIERANKYSIGKPELALKDYMRAISIAPEILSAHEKTIVTYILFLDDKNLALDYLNKFLEINPNSLALHNLRGWVYEQLGDFEKALADYDKALELDQNYETAKNNRQRLTNPDLYKESEALLKQADSLRDNKNYTDAVDAYSKVLELDPNKESAYFRRGSCYNNLKQYEKALADYDKLLELNPNYDKAAHYNRGQAHRNLKNYAEAIADYTKYLEHDPNDQDALFNRGSCYNNMKQYEKALADYNKLIELNPSYNKAAYYNRGQAHRNLKNYAEAIADYTKYLEHDPNDQDALFNRGRCYNETKQYEKALADYNKLIELNPNRNSNAYNNRGVAYENLGKLKEALADYNKSIELDPNDNRYKKNRQRVLDKLKK